MLASPLGAESYVMGPGTRRLKITGSFGHTLDTAFDGRQPHLVWPIAKDFLSWPDYDVQDRYRISLDSRGYLGGRQLKHSSTLRNGPDRASRYLDEPQARDRRTCEGDGEFMREVSMPSPPPGRLEELDERRDDVGTALRLRDRIEDLRAEGSETYPYVVLGGATVLDERMHPGLTHLHVVGSERAPTREAGDDVLVLSSRTVVSEGHASGARWRLGATTLTGRGGGRPEQALSAALAP